MTRKTGRPDKRRGNMRHRLRRRKTFQPILQTLEPRILLFADPFYTAASAESAVDLTLKIENVSGVDILRLIDTTNDTELASDLLTDGRVKIVGSNFADTFRLEIDTAVIPVNLSGGVRFEGGSGSDTLVGPDVSTMWNLTSADAGNLDQIGVVDFTSIENLTGGSNTEYIQHFGHWKPERHALGRRR